MVRVALRVAIGLIFLGAGVSKLMALAETTALLALRHLPAPALLAVLIGVGEALGGILLIGAWRTRAVAIALGLFAIVASILFHLPVALAGQTAFEFGLDAVIVLALFAIAKRDPSLDGGRG
jgi:putative oxidoreductase